ncbi:hypothetical protein HPB49_008781 [Dermacentor silvarum]|uniref:Uncharacterized protein n=1 Tax=Dermacentor silvarum TaxID=543639 RepID=A0ACB8DBU6_DERSI|nr:hypothetical protein HPB49_008781 [Dermacentor silvarum]
MAQRLVLTGLTLARMVQANFTRTSFGSETPAAYCPRPLTIRTVSGLCSRDHSTGGPQHSRLYKDYATITWTVNGRLIENFIDRSTLSTVKDDVSVKVSKIGINQLERLPSDNGKFVTKATLGCIFEDTRTINAQCDPRGASCSACRYLYKPSESPCDYSEQCVFAQLNGVGTDHPICDCALEFVRSLDGKTCDKLYRPPPETHRTALQGQQRMTHSPNRLPQGRLRVRQQQGAPKM